MGKKNCIKRFEKSSNQNFFLEISKEVSIILRVQIDSKFVFFFVSEFNLNDVRSIVHIFHPKSKCYEGD